MTEHRARYLLFMGAPPKPDPRASPTGTRWLVSKTAYPQESDSSFALPCSTYEAANARISMLYEHVIFKPDTEENDISEAYSATEDAWEGM